MSENGWVVICPTLTMCPLHLSNAGSTILMLSSVVVLKGYELLAGLYYNGGSGHRFPVLVTDVIHITSFSDGYPVSTMVHGPPLGETKGGM